MHFGYCNGTGKTYAIMKMIEEVLSANGWVIAIDPVGVYYGLRLDATGKHPSGFNIPIFGGLHGDVPLSPESGKLIADLLCDRRLSAILDVSQFDDSEVNRFATAFGNQFFLRMKARRRAVALILEECQEFIPQNPSKGEERKVHIFNKIAKIGRNHGIGMVMASTRPQDVAKKTLNLAQLMFAFQMTGTHERKAMEDWFTYAGVDLKLASVLPTLEVGEPYFMSPRIMKMNKQVKILPKKTFDASKTPDFDEEEETIALEPLDISQLEEAMGSLIEEAKASDPVALKRKIAQLERELTSKRTALDLVQVMNVPAQEKIVNVPVMSDEQYDAIMQAVANANILMTGLKEQEQAFHEATLIDLIRTEKMIGASKATLEEIRESLAKYRQTQVISPELVEKAEGRWQVSTRKLQIAALAKRGPATYPGTNAYRPLLAEVTAVGGSGGSGLGPNAVGQPSNGLTGPEQRIVNALAWFESIGQTRPLKIAVAVLAGYVPGAGGFTTPASHLSVMRFVIGDGRMTLTDEGRIRSKTPSAPLTQGVMHSQLMSVLKSKGPQRRIMQPLLDAWPNTINKKDLAEAAGYVPGAGGFTTPMSWLNKRRFTESANGGVKAADFLFLQD